MAKMSLILLAVLCLIGKIYAQPSADTMGVHFVEGALMTDFGAGVEGAKIIVTDEDGSLLPVLVTSNSQGQFTIFGDDNQSVIIEPVKDEDFGNGVDILDLFLLKQALHTKQFNSPYQKLAADVNDDGVVDTRDLDMLKEFILGNKLSVLNKPSWKFFDANCLPPLSEPFGMCAGVKNHAFAQSEKINFVAVKMGDLNNNAFSNAQAMHEHVYGDVVLNIPNMNFLAWKEYMIPITWSKDLLACQLAMNLGSLELLDVFVNGQSILDAVGWHKNILSIGLLNHPSSDILTLKVSARETGSLRQMLSLETDFEDTKAYGKEEELYRLKLAFDGQEPSQLTLFQNEPNPFGDETIIRFYLPEMTSTSLTIFDMNGVTWKSEEMELPKGMNHFVVPKSNLAAAGIYFYKIETKSESAVRKMLLLD